MTDTDRLTHADWLRDHDGWTLPPCGHLECADHLSPGCEP